MYQRQISVPYIFTGRNLSASVTLTLHEFRISEIHQRDWRKYVYKNNMHCARARVCVCVSTQHASRINATYVCVRNADIVYRCMTFYS
jgi:hypothetical protein